MSNTYIIDKTHKWLFEVWDGEIRKEEVCEHALRHINDPNLPHPLNVLVDVRKASFEAAIGEEFLQQLCALYQEHQDVWGNAKVAVIPGRNFHRAVLYAHLAGARGVRAIAFHDLANACTWLGISYAEAEEGLAQARTIMLKERNEKSSGSQGLSDKT